MPSRPAIRRDGSRDLDEEGPLATWSPLADAFKDSLSISTEPMKVAEDKICVRNVDFASWSLVGVDVGDTPRTNQDACVVHSCSGERSNVLFIGVFDGHGVDGHKVSNILAETLPELLANSPSFQSGDYHKAIPSVFNQLNKGIMGSRGPTDCLLSGSTAVTALLQQDGKLMVANVGDSRCVLGYIDAWGKVKPVQLSRDHKPDLPHEASRIYAHHGRIAPSSVNGYNTGPKRVWLPKHSLPGLATSRAFGDKIAARVGVVCEPEMLEIFLSPHDRYLILCSDGVTDVMDNADIVETVHHAARHGSSALEATELLVKEAQSRWARINTESDDCTAVIAILSVMRSAGSTCQRRSCSIVKEDCSDEFVQDVANLCRSNSYDIGSGARANERLPERLNSLQAFQLHREMLRDALVT